MCIRDRRILDIKTSAVIIPIPEAAIDVDKPSDKVLVEAILSGTYIS